MLDPRMTGMMIMYQCIVFVFFASIYSSIGFKTHFSLGESTEPVTPTTVIYFTLAAQTTTGFGDIHPVTNTARLLVSMQILCAWLPMLFVFT